MKNTGNHISKAASLFTIAAGCLVLAGWFFDIPSFKSVIPGIISMKFNTAVCFILSGFALYMLCEQKISQRHKSVAFVSAWIVLLAGFLNLLEYIFNWNIGIDELIWKEGTGTAATTYPGRMGLITAVQFMLLGSIFLKLGKRKYHWLIQALVFFMIPSSLLAIFNYLFGNSFLNAFPLLHSMALHTAILFIVLCLGILNSSPLHYIRFSFNKKITGFFILVFSILVFISFAFNRNNEHAFDTARRLEHANEVLLKSQDILSEVQEIQADARGFVITGNEEYLTRINPSVTLILNSIRHLKELTADNLKFQIRIDSIQNLIKENIAFRNFIIQTRRDKGLEPTIKIIEHGKGKKITEQIKSLLISILQEENQLQANRKAENEQNIQNSSRITLFFQIVIALLLLAALLVIYRNIRARDESELRLLAANKELESYIRQLKESQENHSILLNAIDEGFCIIEMIFDEREKPVDYRFLMINASFEKQTGLQNAVGKRMREFAPNHEEHWFEIYGRIALTGEPIRFENRAEQLRRWYDVYAFRFGEPKDLQVAILFNDITGRKQAEETIRLLNLELEKRVEEKTSEVIKKEQQYRFLLQNMREGIQIISYDWRYVFVNNSVVNQSKYSNEELLGHTMMEKYPGIENTEMFKVLQRCMKDRIATVFENEFTFPDGTNEWFELSIQPVPEGVFILSMDITERKKAENNLLKSLKEISDYKYAIDESSIVAFTDQKGIITHVNDNFCKISKYSREELIGRDHRIINSGHHPKEFIRNLWVTIANGEIWRGEIKNRAKDGTVYWVDTTIVPFLKTDGKPFQYLAIRSDITQRKEAEEELLKLNQDLEKRTADLQASNTELERFAYVASHDLQEPLRMVGSFLNLLEEEMDGQLNESSKEYIHFAVDGADRMKTLIQALLQYSRIGTNNEDFSATDLNEVMQFTIRVLEEDIQKTHAIITVNPMPVIIANKTLISQLFKNLIGNSLKYHDGKPPEIEVGFTEEPDKYIFFVKDNGIGIDTKFFDKIFIIFQRLHNRNEYSGTGIGLAICKKIVETHKGKIWLESEPGIGSTFYFSILKTRL